MDDVNALFNQLNEFRWREVSFPTSTFRISLRQDLAEHKYPDRDGAHVESTGRAPLQFTARIPFRNGIVPGKSESWGILYPTTYRKFLSACADRGPGSLVHPELGPIVAKCVSCETDWTADRRDGCDVDVTWIEATESPSKSNEVLDRKSPIATVTLAALDLDAQIKKIKPPLPETPTYEPSFASSMRDLQAIGDQTAIFQRATVGKIDQVQYRVEAVIDSLDNANSPLNWPMRQSCTRLLSASQDLRKDLARLNKTIVLYAVPFESTLGLVAATTGTPISDLMQLNPALVRGAIVAANTVVRYYEAA